MGRATGHRWRRARRPAHPCASARRSEDTLSVRAERYWLARVPACRIATSVESPGTRCPGGEIGRRKGLESIEHPARKRPA